MKLSTSLMGVFAGIGVMLGFFLRDWWIFAMGAVGEIISLLWMIYEKQNDQTR